MSSLDGETNAAEGNCSVLAAELLCRDWTLLRLNMCVVDYNEFFSYILRVLSEYNVTLREVVVPTTSDYVCEFRALRRSLRRNFRLSKWIGRYGAKNVSDVKRLVVCAISNLPYDVPTDVCKLVFEFYF